MRKLLLTVAAALPASALAAQTPAPPVRLINAPDASSQHTFGTIGAIRQLPGGKVLVNDVVKRQLTLLDPALGSATIVADSVSGTANSYGVRSGGLIAYFADSTLFVDPAGLSMFVIDPAGKIARVASVPRSQDAMALGTNLLGNPGLDAKGRLVYRGGFGRVMVGPGAALAGRGGSGGGSGDAARAASLASMFEQPDTTALVRVDLATRKLDTAAFFKIPKNKMNMQQNERGMTVTTEINPLQTVDDWAVLADGSIALVRGQDYHVDFIRADGSTTSSPKISYDWQRLTDEDKIAIIDSAKAAYERARAAAPNTNGAVMAGPGAGGPPGGGGMVINFSMRSGEGGGGVRTGDAGSGPQMTFVSANELPDYRPVFSQGSSRGDADGNLWIRTSATRAGSVGGAIYDVIGQRGELIDRVQIPNGRQIIGFGKGGVVYMTARDDSGAWLERTHR